MFIVVAVAFNIVYFVLRYGEHWAKREVCSSLFGMLADRKNFGHFGAATQGL